MSCLEDTVGSSMVIIAITCNDKISLSWLCIFMHRWLFSFWHNWINHLSWRMHENWEKNVNIKFTQNLKLDGYRIFISKHIYIRVFLIFLTSYIPRRDDERRHCFFLLLYLLKALAVQKFCTNSLKTSKRIYGECLRQVALYFLCRWK